jgi:hypothetical protein
VVNESKGDRTPSDWEPPTATDRCAHAHAYIDIAGAYQLPVTVADRDALRRLLPSCR